jgi:hypothetical protein
VVPAEPVSASAAQPKVAETVVAEEYQSAIDAAPTPVDPAEDAPAPASEPAESSQQSGERHEPISPGAAGNHEPADPRPSGLKLLRRVRLDASTGVDAAQTARGFPRNENLQYQRTITATHESGISPKIIPTSLSPSPSSLARRSAHSILVQIRADIRAEEGQYQLRRTALGRDGPNHCTEPDVQLAAAGFRAAVAWKAAKLADSQQSHLVEKVLKGTDSETIEAIATGLGYRVQNAGLFDCAAAHTLSSSSGRKPPRPVLRDESEATRSTSPPSTGRIGEPGFGSDITARSAAVKVPLRPKSIDTTIVGPLSRILPTPSARPRPDVGEGLTDTRRLVQIGLVLGMAYVAFLTFWFWGTRARGRRAGGGSES